MGVGATKPLRLLLLELTCLLAPRPGPCDGCGGCCGPSARLLHVARLPAIGANRQPHHLVVHGGARPVLVLRREAPGLHRAGAMVSTARDTGGLLVMHIAAALRSTPVCSCFPERSTSSVYALLPWQWLVVSSSQPAWKQTRWLLGSAITRKRDAMALYSLMTQQTDCWHVQPAHSTLHPVL